MLLAVFLSLLILHHTSLLPCDSLQLPNVWSTFSDVSLKTNSISLGQGFPDWSPPQFIIDSISQSTSHQYTRPAGHPNLVNLIAQRYGKHFERSIDPMTEVAVTVGASQALYLTLMTLLRPGDEIVMFEPFFELYLKQIALTGAKPVFVPLKGEGNQKWGINTDRLKSSITSRTKVLLLNTPHNPTGKVFSSVELAAIADVVRSHPDIIVVSDEVYKYTIYDHFEPGDSDAFGHYHFASLSGMWDRTITISSCGKTFSATGWQIGWIVAPQKFVASIQTLLPCVQFCAPAPMQDALSRALPHADLPYEGYKNYYDWLRNQFFHKRKLLEEGLTAIGVEPIQSGGGFFLMGRLPQCSMSEVDFKLKERGLLSTIEPDDWKLCKMLGLDYGVTAIPASPFFRDIFQYGKEFKRGLLARFAFCKKTETLEEVVRRLKTR